MTGLFAELHDQHRPAPDDWPFGDLVPCGYGCILADPAWNFRLYSAKGEGKSAQSHYACMSLAEMRALPVADLAAPDCALFMWATAPMLPDAIDLMRAWGFAYKSAGPWAKQSSTGRTWAFGTGYCFRSAAEFFLLGTRGRPRVQSRSERNLIVAPVREHSRKPDDLHRKAEALYAGPRCELFSRERRPGWASWGNDVDKFTAAEGPTDDDQQPIPRQAGHRHTGSRRDQRQGHCPAPHRAGASPPRRRPAARHQG